MRLHNGYFAALDGVKFEGKQALKEMESVWIDNHAKQSTCLREGDEGGGVEMEEDHLDELQG